MGIIAFLVCLFFLIVSFLKSKKKLLTPATLFYLLWTFILFLSLLNLYDIIKPSSEAYFLILLMIVFFFVGNCLSEIKFLCEAKMKKRIEKKDISIKENTCKIKLKYKLIYTLSAIFIILTLIDCVIVVKSLLDGVPMYTIRRWRMGTFGIDSNPILSRRTFAEELFRSVILTPFEMLLPPIASYSFFNPNENKKNKYMILSLSLVILLLSSFAGGGGRLGFIYYFGCFLLGYLAFSHSFAGFNKKKYKKFIIIILFLGVVSVFVYTQLRTSSSFFKQLYTYFALPPTLLSIWLPKLEGVSHTYGLLTLFGIHSYFFRGLDAIGLDFLVPQIYNDTFQHLLNAEKFYQVGYGVGNAFVTPIYYFLIDGGYIFVCLASLVFGFICSDLYKKISNNMNMKTFVHYALIMYGVFLTFIRIQTAIPAYIISFILSSFLFVSKKKVSLK